MEVFQGNNYLYKQLKFGDLKSVGYDKKRKSSGNKFTTQNYMYTYRSLSFKYEESQSFIYLKRHHMAAHKRKTPHVTV